MLSTRLTVRRQNEKMLKEYVLKHLVQRHTHDNEHAIALSIIEVNNSHTFAVQVRPVKENGVFAITFRTNPFVPVRVRHCSPLIPPPFERIFNILFFLCVTFFCVFTFVPLRPGPLCSLNLESRRLSIPTDTFHFFSAFFFILLTPHEHTDKFDPDVEIGRLSFNSSTRGCRCRRYLGHQLRRVVDVDVVRRLHPHGQLRVTFVRFSSA